MRARIVTLSENTCSMIPGLLAEHGQSILLEAGGTRLLFDTGQSITAAHNAGILNINLKGVPIALSHGHFDHSGGLEHVLKMAGPTPVFCHPDAFAQKYLQREGNLRYIGMPRSREECERMGAVFQVSREPRQIADGVWLTGEIPRIVGFEVPEENLLVMDPQSMDPQRKVDPLLDDQALILEMDEGLLVILGCAHSGMINTIEYAMKITGENRIFGIVGGTHLGFGGVHREKLVKTIEALKRYNLKLLAASHCTGQQAACELAREFEDRFLFNNAGTIIEL